MLMRWCAINRLWLDPASKDSRTFVKNRHRNNHRVIVLLAKLQKNNDLVKPGFDFFPESMNVLRFSITPEAGNARIMPHQINVVLIAEKINRCLWKDLAKDFEQRCRAGKITNVVVANEKEFHYRLQIIGYRILILP